MNDHPFAESVPAYALGALDAGERREFAAHLETCAQCQADLREFRKVTAGLNGAVAPEAPPPALRARTLAHATAQPQDPGAPAAAPLRGSATVRQIPIPTKSTTGVLDRPRGKVPLPRWVPLALAASLTLFVLSALYAAALSWQVNSLRTSLADATDQSDRLREELLAARQDTARLVLTVNVVTAPDVVRVAMTGQEAAPGATGAAYWSRSQGIVFNADRLPALEPSKVYQLWVVSAGQVHSAGIFRVNANGAATFTTPIPANVATISAFAVSLEPDPGVPVRTGPMVLAGTN